MDQQPSSSVEINLIKVFFKILNTIKMFHWKTTVYAHHVASDELHTTLSVLFDKVIIIEDGTHSKLYSNKKLYQFPD